MRILLITRGHFLADPTKYFRDEYNGIKTSPSIAGGFGWFWEKALNELNHEVFVYIYYKNNTLDYPHRISRLWDRVKGHFPVVQERSIRRVNKRLLMKALEVKPDIILIDSGETIYPETLNELKMLTKAKIVIWLLDDPVFNRWSNVIKSFPLFDFVFSFDPEYIATFKTMGASKVEYLPCACDADIHKTFPLTEEELKWGCDLCFIGSLTPSRIPVLEQLREFNLGIWSYYPKSLLKRRNHLGLCYRGIAWGEKMSKIFNASKIVINIHHPQTVSGLNMKTFEIAGCGAFQLVDRKKASQHFFVSESEIVTYEHAQELKELVRYYLDKPSQREAIAQRAQQKAHKEHTYKQRLQQLLELSAR